MERTEICFQTGAILRKEMLEDLYQYPRNVLNSYYDSYGDGILYGLFWKEANEGIHVITPGALKFQGEIYFQEKPLYVEEYFVHTTGRRIESDQKYRIFFLNSQQPEEEPSRRTIVLELAFVQSGGLEDARKHGFYYAYVRMDGRSGLQMIEDTQCLYGMYAGTGRYNYRLPVSELKRLILPVLEQKENRHGMDYELLKGIYAGEGVQTELVELYIREYYRSLGSDVCVRTDDPKMLLEQFTEAAQNFQYKVRTESSERKDRVQMKEENLKIRAQGML